MIDKLFWRFMILLLMATFAVGCFKEINIRIAIIAAIVGIIVLVGVVILGGLSTERIDHTDDCDFF